MSESACGVEDSKRQEPEAQEAVEFVAATKFVLVFE